MHRSSYCFLIFIIFALALFSKCASWNVTDSGEEEDYDSYEYDPDYYKDSDSNVTEEFEGASHWGDYHRELCDDPELDETWRWGEAICLTYVFHFQLVKLEILAWSPALVIYRDFFKPKEVKTYLDMLEKMEFEEQQVVDDDGKDFYSKVRKANGTYIDPEKHPEIDGMMQSVYDRIPNINWESTESVSALSYNPGGHYAVHYDYLMYNKEEDWDHWMKDFGNRMATFIMVFKKSESGGATVFPSLGIAVRAEVGDAFMWFNVMGDGSQEDLSDHGGCPIYKGNKIISTIWIRMANQPIMENIDEPDSISANLLIPDFF